MKVSLIQNFIQYEEYINSSREAMKNLILFRWEKTTGSIEDFITTVQKYKPELFKYLFKHPTNKFLEKEIDFSKSPIENRKYKKEIIENTEFIGIMNLYINSVDSKFQYVFYQITPLSNTSSSFYPLIFLKGK